MIYSIARDTPAEKLFRIDSEKLEEIKTILENQGFNVLLTP